MRQAHRLHSGTHGLRKERREILLFIRNFSLLIDVVRFCSAALVWEPLLLALL